MSISIASGLDLYLSKVVAKTQAAIARLTGFLRTRLPRRAAFWAQFVAALLIAALFLLEADQSYLRSLFYTQLARDASFKVEPGASRKILFPKYGPYDLRLGYVALPFFIQRLEHRHFVIKRQARQSSGLIKFMKAGGYAIYRKKLQADRILTGSGSAPYPRDVLKMNGRDRTVEIAPLTARQLKCGP